MYVTPNSTSPNHAKVTSYWKLMEERRREEEAKEARRIEELEAANAARAARR